MEYRAEAHMERALRDWGVVSASPASILEHYIGNVSSLNKEDRPVQAALYYGLCASFACIFGDNTEAE
jgi:hypothetical protein